MIAQYIANGLLIGSLYACLAVGFSLIYGVLNIINVMHGSFVVLGAYVTIYCTLYLGVSPLIGVASTWIRMSCRRWAWSGSSSGWPWPPSAD